MSINSAGRWIDYISKISSLNAYQWKWNGERVRLDWHRNTSKPWFWLNAFEDNGNAIASEWDLSSAPHEEDWACVDGYLKAGICLSL